MMFSIVILVGALTAGASSEGLELEAVPASEQEDLASQGKNSAPDFVADGRKAYEALDYKKARGFFKRALEVKNLSNSQRLEALAYMGRISAVLNRPEQATRRFEQALDLDPDFVISWEESPRIREAFALAVGKRRDKKVGTDRVDSKAAPKGPPDHLRPPTDSQEEDSAISTQWLIVGGVALAVVGTVTAILLINSDGEVKDFPVHQWELP